MRFVDVKNDVAFRKIFGNEKKSEILISFLNAILKLNGDNLITSVSMLDPFQLGRVRGEKVTIIDVKARDQRGREYIIEMQLTEKKGLDKRIQYYSARGYSSQINVGDDYKKLKPMVFIGILDFSYLESKNYISRHLILDSETNEQKLKDLEFNFIELEKFDKQLDEIDNLVDKWIYFLKHAKNLAVVPQNIKDEGLKEAYEEASLYNWSKEELDAYDYVKMREFDEINEKELAIERAQESAMKKGLAEGIEKGMEKGIEKGMEKGIKQTAVKAIKAGLPNDMIKTLTGLSNSEIEALRKM